MPFKSEKQRRYLHANHPEIAKRWEKEYSHGGILDINESEEIISDDGNDIELTDYNAAFDDPNDLSTGVKTLFQAKDGGRIGFQGGGADQDGWGPGAGSPGTTSSGGNKNTGGSDRGPRDAPDRHGPVSKPQTVPEGINIHGGPTVKEALDEGQRKRDLRDLVEKGPGSDEEKYDTDLVGMKPIDKYLAKRNMIKSKYTGTSKQRLDALNTNFNTERERVEKKMNNFFLKTFGMAFAFGIMPTPSSFVGIDWKNKKLSGVLGDAMALDKLKKTHIDDLEDIKDSLLVDVDINNPNEMVNLDDTAFPDVMKELKDLYKKPEEDDIERNEFLVPPVVPIDQEIEEYEGTYAMSPWDRIKANQAKRALLVEKGIIQENPIVDESVTDITMQANRGGLANLFRVKNQ